ncbi:hypothetical protein EVAR_12607_1 [Eumeta japonica]|uniref:Uncharacterized protein n=1 Tax=Eumeta variegata TaxID=151549 RepID=A0A4C1UFL8_EUMVA|nr:hypothetical protein EVAR_12607_1 [Eumeta japonica]
MSRPLSVQRKGINFGWRSMGSLVSIRHQNQNISALGGDVGDISKIVMALLLWRTGVIKRDDCFIYFPTISISNCDVPTLSLPCRSSAGRKLLTTVVTDAMICTMGLKMPSEAQQGHRIKSHANYIGNIVKKAQVFASKADELAQNDCRMAMKQEICAKYQKI